MTTSWLTPASPADRSGASPVSLMVHRGVKFILELLASKLNIPMKHSHQKVYNPHLKDHFL